MPLHRGNNQSDVLTSALICCVTDQPYPRAGITTPEVCIYCGCPKALDTAVPWPRELEILIPCESCACELVWHAKRGERFSHTLRSGDVGILPPGVRHTKRWLPPANLIRLCLSRSWVDTFGHGLVPDVLVEPLERYSLQDPLVGGLAREMEREFRFEAEPSSRHVAALGHCLAARLLQVLVSRKSRPPANARQLSAETMNRVTVYVEAHLAEKITVAMVAREARLSPGHFSVLFKATHGSTPEQYILRSRLQRAKFLIETGSYTISQIAYMTGFADHSHLTVQFKRRFGVPPKAYLPQVRAI